MLAQVNPRASNDPRASKDLLVTKDAHIDTSADKAKTTERLHLTTLGRGSRVVLVHGFTQTGRSWDEMASELVGEHEIVVVDLPGHGQSSAVHAGIESGARLLADAAGQGTYVGYSMGGRYCLRLALSFPHLVERLVLISTSPGIEDPAERAARKVSDDALAESLDPGGATSPSPPPTAADVPDERARLKSFLHTWLSRPLFSDLDPALARLESRLAENTCAGLASSLRLAGAGVTDPVWRRLGELRMPVLVVAGTRDHKYARIAARMVDEIGSGAQLALIDGAGHAAHLARHQEVARILRAFIESPAPAILGPCVCT